ncbi:Uncharacterized protein D081_0987 [Anaerovibrio sp. JC8]|uniref:DUF1934 domain-containing protein n=1 Tax=Anaerovibrio sp. JC8 TaxID=1240085 RepID=UPI000A0B8732|nr:DUF1934 domain-containing protein [Anaerovibrio sp. JC8]ORU00464.1 Uncharacterized protein D081_0987 [Anaerovibrio sp. JC8]
MNKVKVVTSGFQKDLNGKREKVSHLAEGQYYFRNKKHYIKYDDSSMDQENVIATTIKTDGESLTIFRRGAVDTEMTFSSDKKTSTMYRTPYGPMELHINTRTLEIRMDEAGASGEIDLFYDLTVNGSPVGEYELHIIISNADK